MDAFSSDSIPVHLITREAFEVYLQHLAPGGILAIDITNKHIDLKPVVASAADEFGLEYALIAHKGDGVKSRSTLWAILSSNHDFMNDPVIAERKQSLPDLSDDFQVWTDDYSNLFQVLK